MLSGHYMIYKISEMLCCSHSSHTHDFDHICATTSVHANVYEAHTLCHVPAGETCLMSVCSWNYPSCAFVTILSRNKKKRPCITITLTLLWLIALLFHCEAGPVVLCTHTQLYLTISNYRDIYKAYRLIMIMNNWI